MVVNAQLRIRVTSMSGKEAEQCISKQAYFDSGKKQLIILSLYARCDKPLSDAFENARKSPRTLKIRLIKTAQDYEEVLRKPHELCYVTITEDVDEKNVIWFFIDCLKSKHF
ncbi:unnamed protein product [Gongylonema pulchrum]|uniref:ADF-H domain-containing protein n=1 Tax=Gongylonema pulchrum TaxID=637853 RepID=A0A183EI41_9BILA|nr:unnamed protein product [Gongylonema pulchrum]